jgi:hypothetical protein
VRSRSIATDASMVAGRHSPIHRFANCQALRGLTRGADPGGLRGRPLIIRRGQLDGACRTRVGRSPGSRPPERSRDACGEAVPSAGVPRPPSELALGLRVAGAAQRHHRGVRWRPHLRRRGRVGTQRLRKDGQPLRLRRRLVVDDLVDPRRAPLKRRDGRGRGILDVQPAVPTGGALDERLATREDRGRTAWMRTWRPQLGRAGTIEDRRVDGQTRASTARSP